MRPSTWPTSFFVVVICLFLVAIAAASVKGWRRWLYQPCTTCGGTGKAYQPGKRRKFYGLCRTCGGTGRRLRLGVIFLDWIGNRRDER